MATVGSVYGLSGTDKFFKALRNRFPLFLLIVLLLSLSTSLKPDGTDGFRLAKVRFLTCIISSVAPAMVLYAAALYRKWIKYVSCGFLWILFFADLFIFFNFRTHISDRIILLILQTDNREVSEFFGQFILRKGTLAAAATCVLLASLYRLSIPLWNRMIHNIDPHRYRKPAIAATIALCILSLSSLSYTITGPVKDYMGYPTIYLFVRSTSVIQSNSGTLARIERAAANTDGENDASVYEDPATRPDILFIIGESYNPHHAEIYGYDLNTTPNLTREQEAGNILIFRDVVTPSSATTKMMEVLFSPANPDDEETRWDVPVFPAIFRHAGYNVTLHDNQTTRLNGDLRWDAGNMFFFNSTIVENLSLDYRNDRLDNYDLPFCRNELDSLSKFRMSHPGATISIFHLTGQHMPASRRYPETWNPPFSDNDYGHRPELSISQKSDVASYDNATFYNDMTIAEIYRSIAGKDAVAIYVSDHGEEVHDYRNNYGRTLEPVTKDIARNIYSVPLIIYTTDIFRTKHPELYHRIEQATQKKIYTADIGQMLLSIGGIRTRFHEPDRDPLSMSYSSANRRILNGEVDFDKMQ